MNSGSKALDLQDRAAIRIYKQTSGMSREQELQYWQKKSAHRPYDRSSSKSPFRSIIREQTDEYGRRRAKPGAVRGSGF